MSTNLQLEALGVLAVARFSWLVGGDGLSWETLGGGGGRRFDWSGGKD